MKESNGEYNVNFNERGRENAIYRYMVLVLFFLRLDKIILRKVE